MTDKQDLYQEAMKFAKEKASISYVQRKCRCSYNDAERMLEQMVSDGVISTYNGRKGGEAVGAGGVSGPLVGRAAPPTAQAEGWRLVPVEPTVEQEWEGKQAALRGLTMAEACKIYKAMIAKAPTPPTSAEGVEHG